MLMFAHCKFNTVRACFLVWFMCNAIISLVFLRFYVVPSNVAVFCVYSYFIISYDRALYILWLFELYWRAET